MADAFIFLLLFFTAFSVLVISFNLKNNPLSCSFFDISNMCFLVASNSTFLTLPPGTWQIMQDPFRYGSNFDLVVNPSEV